MKTRFYLMVTAVLLLCGTVQLQAQVSSAKFCKTFADYTAGHWTAVSSLGVNSCELKFTDNEFKFRTDNKEATKHLKKEALVVQYGGHLYVNCRNLDCDEFSLDCANYAQAYRYGGKGMLLVAYRIDGGALLASLAGDIVGVAAPAVVGAVSSAASSVIWYGSKDLRGFRCYLLENSNDDGEAKIKGLNDEFMEKLLADNAALLKQYKAANKKSDRLSASHILPILRDKGLIKE